jgi:hypothetical protein
VATKKQRRRRAKEHRHDYVWVDDEGNELDPEEAATSEKATPRGRAPRRDPQAPSWQRTFKRGAIFAPIMFGTVFLLSPNLPVATKITQTLFIVAIFVPFSYFLDRLFYERARRRAGQQPHGRRGS